MHKGSRSSSLVTKWGRNGKNGGRKVYRHESYEESVIRFEKIFRQKTGLEWKTGEKKARGQGYSCPKLSHPQVRSATICGTQDHNYKEDGTGEIRFSEPSKAKADKCNDGDPFWNDASSSRSQPE